MSRTELLLGGKRYSFAKNLRSGALAFEVTPRASQPGDPGGLDYRDFTPWGHDLNSRRAPDGHLGPEYHDGTDGRWENVDCLGPELGTLDLTTYDARDSHAAALLGSTFILGSATTGFLGGAVAVATADDQQEIKSGGGITYAYIARGQLIGKVRLSNLTLIDSGKTFSQAITGLVVTRAALASVRTELSAALGQNVPYESLKEDNISLTTDSWAANASSVSADAWGLAPDRVLALDNQTIRGNILTGSVTMATPTYNTVATITNLPNMRFTGYVLDGNISLIGSTIGPLVLNIQTAEFRPLIAELESSPSTENMRQADRWYALGAVLPLRDGVRYSNGLAGESWGVETFLGNSSLVRGYPTGGHGSTKWYVQAVYDEITTDTWLVAWRPRQAGDHQAYSRMSPFVIGHLTAQQARYVRYVGYANGERTMPLWTFGRGTSMGYFLDGRSSRFIDDANYRFATAGTTYLAEDYFSGVVADVEAVEFMTANCSGARTVTPKLSIDAGASYVSLTAQTTDGFHRVLAVSGGAPLATLQGANRLKPALTYAGSATSSPRVISPIRVYFRWRPLELRVFTWRLELTDQDSGQTAKEQETTLEGLRTSVPQLVTEDQDNETYYVRIDSVDVTEQALESGGDAGERGSVRVATVKATEWKVA